MQSVNSILMEVAKEEAIVTICILNHCQRLLRKSYLLICILSIQNTGRKKEFNKVVMMIGDKLRESDKRGKIKNQKRMIILDQDQEIRKNIKSIKIKTKKRKERDQNHLQMKVILIEEKKNRRMMTTIALQFDKVVLKLRLNNNDESEVKILNIIFLFVNLGMEE